MPQPLDIQAGTLRHPITIVTDNTGNVTAFGTPVTTQSIVWACRASIQSTSALSYRELVSAQSLSSTMTHLIVIRYPGSSITIAPGMTVKHGNDSFAIQAVDNLLERNRFLNLLCKATDKSSTSGGAE